MIRPMSRVIDEVVEEALRELADPSAQEEMWRASAGPRLSSLTECRSRLWDDSGLADALDGQGGAFTAEIDEQFRALRRLLRQIDDRQPPDAILNDPRLEEARLLARRLLTDVRSLGEDDG